MNLERTLRHAIEDTPPLFRPIAWLLLGPPLLVCWLIIDILCLGIGLQMRARDRRKERARRKRP